MPVRWLSSGQFRCVAATVVLPSPGRPRDDVGRVSDALSRIASVRTRAAVSDDHRLHSGSGSTRERSPKRFEVSAESRSTNVRRIWAPAASSWRGGGKRAEQRGWARKRDWDQRAGLRPHTPERRWLGPHTGRHPRPPLGVSVTARQSPRGGSGRDSRVGRGEGSRQAVRPRLARPGQSVRMSDGTRGDTEPARRRGRDHEVPHKGRASRLRLERRRLPSRVK